MSKIVTLTAAAAFALAVGFAGTANAGLTDDLVGLWNFDTNSGTDPALDGSVNSNDGTLTGDATHDTSVLPPIPNNTKSLSVGGTGSMQTPGGSSPIDLTGDYTVAAWFKTDTGGIDMDIFGAHNAAGTKFGLLAEVRTDGTLRWLHRPVFGVGGGVIHHHDKS